MKRKYIVFFTMIKVLYTNDSNFGHCHSRLLILSSKSLQTGKGAFFYKLYFR